MFAKRLAPTPHPLDFTLGEDELLAQLPALGQQAPKARVYGWLEADEVESQLPAIARLFG